MSVLGSPAAPFRSRGAGRVCERSGTPIAHAVALARRGLAIVFTASLLFALTWHGPAAPAPNAQRSDAEAAAGDVVRSFVTAWNANDTSALTDLFAPDGSFTSPSGAKAVGAAQIRQLLTQEHRDIYKGTTLVEKTSAIHFSSKGLPIAKGRFTLKGVDVAFGFEVAADGAYTFRFRQVDHRWKIASARITRQ